MSDITVQWGLALDCKLNGCKPPHDDDGRVQNIKDYPPVKAWHLNGHKTRIVKRAVTIVEGEWTDA